MSTIQIQDFVFDTVPATDRSMLHDIRSNLFYNVELENGLIYLIGIASGRRHLAAKNPTTGKWGGAIPVEEKLTPQEWAALYQAQIDKLQVLTTNDSSSWLYKPEVQRYWLATGSVFMPDSYKDTHPMEPLRMVA
jgi:hypothetical protein